MRIFVFEVERQDKPSKLRYFSSEAKALAAIDLWLIEESNNSYHSTMHREKLQTLINNSQTREAVAYYNANMSNANIGNSSWVFLTGAEVE